MNSIRPVLVFALAAALVSSPTPARADKCSGAKLKASGQTVSGALKCDSKAEAKGTPGGGASCEAKADASLSKNFQKADAKGACPGSASAVLDLLETCESAALSAVGASDTAPTASKCDSKKVAAMAKKASAKLDCLSKQASRGKDPSDCLASAKSKFNAAIGKLSSATDCSNPSTAATLEAVIDSCVDSVASVLTPSSTTTTSSTTSTTTTTIPTTTVPTTTTSTTTSSTTSTTLASCQLGNGIQHVIHITFDNVHFTRDNPDVPSDLEQMPTLLAFIESNGTMLSNHHTPLIAHTGSDSFTEYTGLYGDRHGMGISNSYEYYNGTAVTSADSFVYWTSPIIDHGPQLPSVTDLNPSMVYSEQVPPLALPSSTGHDAMAPAPWAVFTKVGCDVGDVSTANMVLEKFADIPTVFGPTSPEAQQLAADTGDTFKDAEIDDYIGLSVHCGQVGGVNSPFCTNAMAVKYNPTTPSPSAVPEVLPDEPGGYSNFLAVHGSRYLTPLIGGGASMSHDGYVVTDANANLVDLDGQTIVGAFRDLHPGQTGAPQFNPGFPGFSPTASETLAYIAGMQEAGIPITYAYISDVHDKKFPNGSTTRQTGCTTPGNAMGPGDTCYKANLAAYDAAFATFFQRL